MEVVHNTYSFTAPVNGYFFAVIGGGMDGVTIDGIFYQISGHAQSTTFMPIDAGKTVSFTKIAGLIFVPCKE